MRIIDTTQGSPEWLEARRGLPTASQFHRLITPKTRKPSSQAAKYAAELLTEWALGPVLDGEGNAWMQRGTDLEDGGRRWYEAWRLPEGEVVERPGFIVADDGLCGCSPDGLVGTDGGLEIKTKSAVAHVLAMLAHEHDEHVCQVQGSMMITGRKWWDLLYWSPALPPHVVRIERDDEFIEALSSAVATFHCMLDAWREELIALGVSAYVPPPPVELSPEQSARVRMIDELFPEPAPADGMEVLRAVYGTNPRGTVG